MKDNQPQAGWVINVFLQYHYMQDTQPQAGQVINVFAQYHVNTLSHNIM